MPEPDAASNAAAWFQAVAFALTGQATNPSSDPGGVSASAIAGWLVEQGWTPDLLAGHRRARRDEGLPWPHPVPPSMLGPGTAARLHALVVEVRNLTGTSGLVPTQRPERRALTADDRRLLADVPPHHGNV